MQPGRVSPDQLFTNRAERRNGFARNNCRGVSGRRCPLIPATAPLDRTADPTVLVGSPPPKWHPQEVYQRPSNAFQTGNGGAGIEWRWDAARHKTLTDECQSSRAGISKLGLECVAGAAERTYSIVSNRRRTHVRRRNDCATQSSA